MTHSWLPPSWLQSVEIGDLDQLEIRATDRDVLFEDAIGVCTSQGMPWVDERGYALGDTFQCFSQLWAVALRVLSVKTADGQPLQMDIAPETRRD